MSFIAANISGIAKQSVYGTDNSNFRLQSMHGLILQILKYCSSNILVLVLQNNKKAADIAKSP